MNWGAMAGAVVSIGSSLLSSKSESDTAKDNSAELRREAAYQRERGEIDADKHMESVRKLIAQGNLAFAKSGVRLSSTSVSEVFTENMGEGLFDAAMIRADAESKARQAEAGSTSYSNESKNAKTAGYLEAGSTLLTEYGKGTFDFS